ncbi:MAG: DUF5317 family protein [Eubacteriaceae bacterium]|nr:DUF5317 family protein [Eubacteriaceae bacterium]
MVLIAFFLAGTIWGFAQKGSISNIANTDFRAWHLFAASILLFALLRIGISYSITFIANNSYMILLAAYCFLMLGIMFNVRGLNYSMLFLLAGALANFAAIFLNNGEMPFSEKAALIAKIPVDAINGSPIQRIADGNTVLGFLGGIIPVPLPLFPEIASIGTLFLGIGMLWTVKDLLAKPQFNSGFEEFGFDDEDSILDGEEFETASLYQKSEAQGPSWAKRKIVKSENETESAQASQAEEPGLQPASESYAQQTEAEPEAEHSINIDAQAEDIFIDPAENEALSSEYITGSYRTLSSEPSEGEAEYASPAQANSSSDSLGTRDYFGSQAEEAISDAKLATNDFVPVEFELESSLAYEAAARSIESAIESEQAAGNASDAREYAIGPDSGIEPDEEDNAFEAAFPAAQSPDENVYEGAMLYEGDAIDGSDDYVEYSESPYEFYSAEDFGFDSEYESSETSHAERVPMAEQPSDQKTKSDYSFEDTIPYGAPFSSDMYSTRVFRALKDIADEASNSGPIRQIPVDSIGGLDSISDILDDGDIDFGEAESWQNISNDEAQELEPDNEESAIGYRLGPIESEADSELEAEGPASLDGIIEQEDIPDEPASEETFKPIIESREEPIDVYATYDLPPQSTQNPNWIDISSQKLDSFDAINSSNETYIGPQDSIEDVVPLVDNGEYAESLGEYAESLKEALDEKETPKQKSIDDLINDIFTRFTNKSPDEETENEAEQQSQQEAADEAFDLDEDDRDEQSLEPEYYAPAQTSESMANEASDESDPSDSQATRKLPSYEALRKLSESTQLPRQSAFFEDSGLLEETDLSDSEFYDTTPLYALDDTEEYYKNPGAGFFEEEYGEPSEPFMEMGNGFDDIDSEQGSEDDIDYSSPFIIENGRIVENPNYKFRKARDSEASASQLANSNQNPDASRNPSLRNAKPNFNTAAFGPIDSQKQKSPRIGDVNIDFFKKES